MKISCSDPNGAFAPTVDIGPHYLALDAVGNPFDSNAGSPDGIPDFIADANGDGSELGEIPWQSQNNSALAILAPPLTPVSGVITLRVNPGPYATTLLNLTAIADPQPSAPFVFVSSRSRPEIDVDTRFLPNDLLTLRVRATFADYSSGRQFSTADSPPVTITVANPICFSDWDSWTGLDTAVFNLSVPDGPDRYTLDVFDSDYPKSYAPLATANLEGELSGAGVSCPVRLIDYGLQDGSQHPNVYAFATVSQAGTPVSSPQVTPATIQDTGFPDQGWWYLAYEDSFNKAYDPAWGRVERPVRDTLQPMSTLTWFRDGALEGWKGVAAWPDPSHAAPNLYDPPVSGVSETWPQTWPIRYCDYHVPVNGRTLITPSVLKDWTLFCRRAANRDFRNLYIGSHMTGNSIGILPADQLWALVQQSAPHRYHFVFLDGCESGASYALSAVFGFDQTEWTSGAPITYYQGLDPQTHGKRQRPGGGIVFKTSFNFFVPTPNDLTWAGYIPEEFAQFYMDFQQNWTLFGRRLVDALDQARTSAQGKQSNLTDPPWHNDCADTIGYWDLHHNQFNSASATW